MLRGLVLMAIALSACRGESPPSDARLGPEAQHPSPASVSSETRRSSLEGVPALSAVRGASMQLLELVKAPPDVSVRGYLRTERLRAQREGRTLLVLVGAEWCAPCRSFHARLAREEVRLPVRIVEFDVDVHDEGLKAAGYTSKLIPLVAKPSSDGTPERLEEIDSRKEEGADEVLRRIKQLANATN